MMETIFHIRKQMKQNSGTNFYLDRSNRSNGTFCGHPETQYDRAWNNSVKPFNNGVNLFVPCKNCREKKDEK